jgi:hypothetical protein
VFLRAPQNRPRVAAKLKGNIMDNLSLTADISSHIGALELGGAWEHYNDGMLETAARASTGPTGSIPCTRMNCIGDAALETAAHVTTGPTQIRANCAGDEVL